MTDTDLKEFREVRERRERAEPDSHEYHDADYHLGRLLYKHAPALLARAEAFQRIREARSKAVDVPIGNYDPVGLLYEIFRIIDETEAKERG